MNSKQKGNMGVGRAIAYYTSLGYSVSIPLTDSQDYDLVVDIDGILRRVQVKFTSATAPSGNYVVTLRSISGTSRAEYKTLVDTDIDLVFIMTPIGCYEMPIKDIKNRSTITVTSDISEKFRVG